MHCAVHKNAQDPDVDFPTFSHVPTNTTIMPATDLPAREGFLTDGLELDTCAICLLEFGPYHLPVRFTAHDSCNHTFGKSCIEKWLLSNNDNANACPTCRRPLYRKDYNDQESNHDDSATDGTENSESAEESEEGQPQSWRTVPGR